MNNHQPLKAIRSQQGAVLIVSLIILLLITIVGASTMRTATMEEKMAAAVRNKDIALQAAEAALAAGEKVVLDDLTNTTGFTDSCANGMCTELAITEQYNRWEQDDICGNDADIWTEETCNKSIALTGANYDDTDSGYAQAPRYFIELLTSYQPVGDNINVNNTGEEVRNDEVTVFRVTALGFGGTQDAQVLLQTTVAKKL